MYIDLMLLYNRVVLSFAITALKRQVFQHLIIHLEDYLLLKGLYYVTYAKTEI